MKIATMLGATVLVDGKTVHQNVMERPSVGLDIRHHGQIKD